ncbi:SCE4755 family polysaccharide monooxygenase-like protein [Paraliomyxa miuraensis]|uniref:SCE4755 family polysaccharide monooxygenase-like protein n=1 Tax=Paraliomyxa miuraensis TaxID=376150 RepID=UPI0022543D56|nr:SCE4755 family polysaccharide monooxygenase-like protein [Paraliomyxa miuraensis]MCX4246261.1 lytic polysaccharide monooxygenase [Paraliomyxa miuraensis]
MILRMHAPFVRVFSSWLNGGRLAAALGLSAGLWATPAAAHIELLSPSARYTPDQQKNPPCGAQGNPAGDGTVTVFQVGETITVEWDEFIDHPGHFRIALDPTGSDAFVSPTDFDDFYNSPEVLLDDIADAAGGLYQVEVTLPDEPCDPCTLQLIQVMNDGAWGPGDSDLYYQCADIVIEPAGGGSADGTSGNGTGGGGDSTGGGGDTGVGSTGGGGSGTGMGEGGPTSDDGGSGGSGSEGSGTTDDSDGDEGGCSCRAGEGPAGGMPWMLVAWLAWRGRGRIARRQEP